MRIFCGLTGDTTTIAAAIVNERGGVIATSEVTDDAFGYLALCRMWVRHADILRVAVADHDDTRDLRRLAASAGQPTASAKTVDVSSGDPLDKAVHIARMLARGELTAQLGTGEPAATCQLVGGLHTLSRTAHASHASLIELLRQTHPAALAAWGDPTETAALEVLRTAHGAEAATGDIAPRAKPEPSRVKELALALERTQRARQYQLEPRVAGAIAATAESVLAAERACLALATALDDLVAAPVQQPAPRRGRRRTETAPETPAEPPPTRSRRSASERLSASEAPAPRSRRRAEPEAEPTIPRPRRKSPDPLPTRTPSVQTEPDVHDEPVTAPLHPRAERPRAEAEGFPLMPEPPKYVEPKTTTNPTTSTEPATDLLSAPVSQLPTGMDEADDDDLLIFSQARSAWFKGPAAIEDSEEAWKFQADEGWRAAEATSDNRLNTDTTPSGLPRRVPQANLVPGSAILSDAPTAPISRDATALASRTAGFFRGWGRARRETVGAGTGS